MDEDFIPLLMFASWLVLVTAIVLLNRNRMRREVRYREAIYGKVLWRPSSLVTFSSLNQEFYQATQAALESVGYRFVADYEDEKLAGTYMDPRTVRRIMLSKDRKVVARFFQYNFSPWRQMHFIISRGLKYPYVIDLFSEAVDGRIFRLLDIAAPMRPFEPAEMTIRYAQPGGKTADALSGYFIEEWNNFVLEHHDFAPRTFLSYEDVLDSEERQQELRSSFRREKGLMFAEELEGEGMPAKSAGPFVRAFERQRKRMGR